MSKLSSMSVSYPTRLDWLNTILLFSALLLVAGYVLVHLTGGRQVYYLALAPIIIFGFKYRAFSYKSCPVESLKSEKGGIVLFAVLFVFVNIFASVVILKSFWFLFLTVPLSMSLLLVGNPSLHEVFNDNVRVRHEIKTALTTGNEQILSTSSLNAQIGFILGLFEVFPEQWDDNYVVEDGKTTFKSTDGLIISIEKDNVSIELSNAKKRITLSYPSIDAMKYDSTLFSALKQSFK